MASSSACTSASYNFDVVINCSSSDDNSTFVTDLYHKLLAWGMRVFLDFDSDGPSKAQTESAIRTAYVCVPIFSPRYADSIRCLNELLLMLESGATIIPVFHHVTPAELRWTRDGDGVFAQALRNLEEKKVYDPQTHDMRLRYESNTIEHWRNSLSHVSSLSGFELDAFNGDKRALLDGVVEYVLRNVKIKIPPLPVAKYPTGLDERVRDFENKVLLQRNEPGKPSVVGIVGSGGVGKTTLAKELFNRMSSTYSRSCFLTGVREEADRGSLILLQRRFLEHLSGSDGQIENIDEGVAMLKKHLSTSNVFLVLDDVDHPDQVEALLPDKATLCSDSFILITSRDKGVLASLGVGDESIYKLSGLSEQHSRELFCSHAFSQPYPPPGFESMVDDVSEACGGLPLSLTVIGALLFGKDESYWKGLLRKLQRILPTDIQSRLRISYDSLDLQEKEIFLDIACFFIGEDRDKALRIWDGCGWEGSFAFRNLENKSLVEVDSDNYIRMHDHLRDMGRGLAEDGPIRRLWRPVDSIPDEVSQQLSVRGIHMAQRSGQSLEGPVELGNRFINFTLSNAVVDMTNRFISSIFGNRFVDIGNRSTRDESLLDLRRLQLLRAEGDCLGSISKGLSNSDLVWLRWDMYPYTSLPVWIPRKKLRVLEVTGAELETLWQDESEAPIPIQLRELNISSTRLLRVPESTGQLRHLEKMDLSSCRNLQTLPSSLGNLANLRYINLNGCWRLENLPDSFGNLSRLQYLSLADCSSLTFSSITFGNIRTLETLDLSNCRRMETLPLQVTVQRYLKELNLKHTSITELPIAIGNLGNLEILRLQCPFLEMLPLGGLSSLRELTLQFCNKLRQLPESVGELTHLTTLFIHYAQIEYLPAAVMRLNNLEILKVTGCPLLEVPFNLRDSSIDKICMIGLRQMDLQGTRLKELSFCKGVCPNLQRLNVSYCHELVVVGALPTALISLNLQECRALKEIIGLAGLAQLRLLDISGCDKIEEMPGVDTLCSLNQVRLDGCNKVDGLKMKRISRDSCDVSSGKKLRQ